MSGLDLVAPELARILESSDMRTLRRVARAASSLVLTVYPTRDERLVRARSSLDAEQLGESQARDELASLVDELDEVQLDLGDELDAYGHGSTEAEYASAFGRFTAANTLWYALDSDPFTAVLEGLYECHAALDDTDFVVISALVHAVLRGDEDAAEQALAAYRSRGEHDQES